MNTKQHPTWILIARRIQRAAVGVTLAVVTALSAWVGQLNEWPYWPYLVPSALFLVTVVSLVWAYDKANAATEVKVTQIAPSSSNARSNVYLHMVYSDKQFDIFNDGPSNLELWGTRLSKGPRAIESAPRIVSPNGGSYHIFLPKSLENEILNEIPEGKDSRVPFDLFLRSEMGENYVATFTLWIRVVDRTILIETQLTSLRKVDWTNTSA